MAGQSAGVGRLWVAVDANIGPAITKLDLLDKKVREVKNNINTMGGNANATASGLQKTAAAAGKVSTEANKAARGVAEVGLRAQSAAKPMKALEAAMFRSSQAFINLRYGNPLGFLAGASQAAGSLGTALKGIAPAAGGAAAGMAGLIAAIAAAPVVVGVALTGIGAAIAKSGVSAAADLEQLKISFEGMLGSAQAATEEVAFLQSLAQTSIVPTDQIMEANRQLMAFGITSQTMRQDLVKFMADYGSAVNLSTGQIQGLAYVIGQINAQGKAYTQDIKQLANASIGIDKLAKSLGMTTGEFQKMVASGNATADKLLPAIVKVGKSSEETAKKMNESAKGMISNIKDIANVKMSNAFGGLLASLKPILQWVKDFIKAFNFEYIAQAWEQVVGYFKQSMGDMGADAEGTAASISQTIAKAINLIGYVASITFAVMRALWNTFMLVVNGVWAAIQLVVGQVLDKLGGIIEVASYVPGPWQDAMKSATESIKTMANAAVEGANIAGGAFVNSAAAAGNAWAGLVMNFPKFKEVSFGKNIGYTPGGNGFKTSPTPGFEDTVGDTTGDSKKDPRLKKWQEWIKFMRELINDFKEALKELKGLTAQPFGEMSKIAEAFSFGDASSNYQGNIKSIIGMFDTVSAAITKYYRVFASPKAGGKAAAAKAAAERDSMLNRLKEDTQRLVDLARENERIAKELDTWQKTETDRLQSQMDALDAAYNGTFDARGYAIEGAISKAQSMLDKATQAYDDANAKLADLVSARDEFLNGIRDSARSFVNALELSAKTITEYTRLDNVGSFISTEKQKTASLKDQMAERLQTLKDWAANIKALQARGLSSTLLQDLVSQGPEATSQVMTDLVNGSQQSIDEINSIQTELASVTAGIQRNASQTWFDAGIAQQQAFVNQMQIAKDAANQALLDTQAAYQMKKAALDADLKAVADATDAHSLVLKAQLEANAKTAADISASIEKSLAKLTDPKNPKNTAILGKNAMDGFIKGLEEMEPLVVAAAERIANKVSSTISKALKINSPSKVMEQYGAWVGEGLAIGMESSLSRVEVASLNMSNATLPSLNGSGQSVPDVRVYIGDRELTDMIDVRVAAADGSSLNYVTSGRRY